MNCQKNFAHVASNSSTLEKKENFSIKNTKFQPQISSITQNSSKEKKMAQKRKKEWNSKMLANKAVY
jgi:hypothetical protein